MTSLRVHRVCYWQTVLNTYNRNRLKNEHLKGAIEIIFQALVISVQDNYVIIEYPVEWGKYWTTSNIYWKTHWRPKWVVFFDHLGHED